MEFLESVFLTGFFGRFFLEGFFGRIFWKDFSGKVGFFSEGVCAVHGLFFGEGGVFSVFFDWLFLRSVSMAMHCIPANDSYFVVSFFPFFFLSFFLSFFFFKPLKNVGRGPDELGKAGPALWQRWQQRSDQLFGNILSDAARGRLVFF